MKPNVKTVFIILVVVLLYVLSFFGFPKGKYLEVNFIIMRFIPYAIMFVVVVAFIDNTFKKILVKRIIYLLENRNYEIAYKKMQYYKKRSKEYYIRSVLTLCVYSLQFKDFNIFETHVEELTNSRYSFYTIYLRIINMLINNDLSKARLLYKSYKSIALECESDLELYYDLESVLKFLIDMKTSNEIVEFFDIEQHSKHLSESKPMREIVLQIIKDE